jgi:hypothetical protein
MVWQKTFLIILLITGQAVQKGISIALPYHGGQDYRNNQGVARKWSMQFSPSSRHCIHTLPIQSSPPSPPFVTVKLIPVEAENIVLITFSEANYDIDSALGAVHS